MTVIDALLSYAREGAYTTKSDAYIKERALSALSNCDMPYDGVVKLSESSDLSLWLGCEKDSIPCLTMFARVSGVSLQGKAREPLDWQALTGCPSCGQLCVDPSWNPTEATRFGGRVVGKLEATAPAALAAAAPGQAPKQETILIELPNSMYEAWNRSCGNGAADPWKLVKFKEEENSAADANFRRLEHFFKWNEAAKKGEKFGGLDTRVLIPVPVPVERNWDAIVVITNIAADGETL